MSIATAGVSGSTGGVSLTSSNVSTCGESTSRPQVLPAGRVVVPRRQSAATRRQKWVWCHQIRIGRQVSYAILILVMGMVFYGCRKEDNSTGLTRALEIAIDTNDLTVMNVILYKALSGDSTAEEAMRTANPERLISLAKKGDDGIDAEAMQFLHAMEGFGNKRAHEAISR